MPNLITGAKRLLYGERYGFAIDATTYDTVTAAAYVGGPVGGTLAVKADNVTDKPNIPLDAAAGLLKGASPLMQSGTSAKMVHFPSSPYVRWSSHNFIENSQDLAGSDWDDSEVTTTNNATTAPDGTTTAARVIESSATNNHHIVTASGLSGILNGPVYTTSFYAKATGRTWVAVTIYNGDDKVCYFDIGNGVIGSADAAYVSTSITSVGNSWYRCVATITSASTSHFVNIGPASANNTRSYAGNGTSGIYVWGVQTVRGYNANPYLYNATGAAKVGIPQSYDTAAAQYGILVEPAGTNLIQYSEALDNGSVWGSSGCTRTGSAADGPEGGTTTADRLSATSGSSGKYAFQGFTAANTASHTISAYIKSDGGQWIGMCVDGGVQGNGVFFDVINGVLGTVGGGTGTITAIGNGWYRCTATKSATAGSRTLLFEPHGADNEGQTWNSASGAEKFLIWGAQVEESSVATSYIPTLGSTVTRATDNLTVAVPSFPFTNPCSEVIYANTLISANMWLIQIDPGSESTNRFLLYDDTATFTLYSGVTISTTPDHTIGTPFKGAARFKSGDFAAVLNGGTVGTDAGTNAVTGSTTLRIGIGASANNNLNGFVYQFTYFSRELSNAELQAKTT